MKFNNFKQGTPTAVERLRILALAVGLRDDPERDVALERLRNLAVAVRLRQTLCEKKNQPAGAEGSRLREVPRLPDGYGHTRQ